MRRGRRYASAMNTFIKRTLAALTGAALLSGCSSVNIGIGLPIGRYGGISVGGTVPLPSNAPKPAASAASAAVPAVSP